LENICGGDDDIESNRERRKKKKIKNANKYLGDYWPKFFLHSF
jgi:hypothetical protein